MISKLRLLVIEKQEHADGYAYLFSGKDTPPEMLDEFVAFETQCCEFLNFVIAASACGDLWLVISGPEGAKEFIDKELEF